VLATSLGQEVIAQIPFLRFKTNTASEEEAAELWADSFIQEEFDATAALGATTTGGAAYYLLKAVVCGVADHFVALVLRSNQWWLMSDEKALRCGSLAAARRRLCRIQARPVLAFWQLDEGCCAASRPTFGGLPVAACSAVKRVIPVVPKAAAPAAHKAAAPVAVHIVATAADDANDYAVMSIVLELSGAAEQAKQQEEAAKRHAAEAEAKLRKAEELIASLQKEKTLLATKIKQQQEEAGRRQAAAAAEGAAAEAKAGQEMAAAAVREGALQLRLAAAEGAAAGTASAKNCKQWLEAASSMSLKQQSTGPESVGTPTSRISARGFAALRALFTRNSSGGGGSSGKKSRSQEEATSSSSKKSGGSASAAKAASAAAKKRRQEVEAFRKQVQSKCLRLGGCGKDKEEVVGKQRACLLQRMKLAKAEAAAVLLGCCTGCTGCVDAVCCRTPYLYW